MVEAEYTPEPSAAERIGKLIKKSFTSSGVQPGTSYLVAECLIHYATYPAPYAIVTMDSFPGPKAAGA
jgi:hypothetical protein